MHLKFQKVQKSAILFILFSILYISISANSQSNDDFLDFDDAESEPKKQVGNKNAIKQKQSSNDDFSEFNDPDDQNIDLNEKNEFDDKDLEEAEENYDEEEDGVIEDDDSEVKDPKDFDSFEDFGDEQIIDAQGNENIKGRTFKEKRKAKNDIKIKQIDIPSHLRNNWRKFYIEGFLIIFIIWYIVNYFLGKKMNEDIRNNWMNENIEFLKSQFYEVGGATSELDTVCFNSNSSDNFTLWCTGRKGMEGMLVELRLVGRQDLITCWRNRFNKKGSANVDSVTFTVYFDDEFLTEPIILAVGLPKLVNELWRNFIDLRTYCPKGPKEKSNINKNFTGCSENIEMMNYIFDSKTITTFNGSGNSDNELPNCKLGYMHISDKYESMYIEEDESKKLNMELCNKVMVLNLILTQNESEKFNSIGFTKGLIYIIDRLKRMKLSKEVKSACEKRRIKALEDEQKKLHSSRTKKAQDRTEQKRKLENQKIMDEEDPEKQKKLYEARAKKDERKKAKRFGGSKQVKMK